MLVLGIETSCDETGVALYDTSRGSHPSEGLIAENLHSQIDIHAVYGGVVPELAARDHGRRLLPMIDHLLKQAGYDIREIEGIAYTAGPGLAGALRTGVVLGRSLAASLGIPALGVHHLEGHLLSPFLSPPEPGQEPLDFPFLALLVSGGHTQLHRVDALGVYTLLGESVDDAAGEAFDKSAKMLGLGYPGGSALSALAQTGIEQNPLPRPMLRSKDFNFSFSGLKTAVLERVQRGVAHTPSGRANLAAEVETAIVDVLVSKCSDALGATKLSRLVIAGGVSANQKLRAQIKQTAALHGARLWLPAPRWCTDNGAMIAYVGALRLALGEHQNDLSYTVYPRWDLQSLKAPGA